MARNHARILTAIWSDADFLALNRHEQLLYIVTITQPNMNLCGVVQYSPRRWARLAADGNPTDVEAGMARLTERRFVYLDPDAEEVLARTFVKHDGVLKSPNSVIGMSRDYGGIQSPTLQAAFLAQLPAEFAEQLHRGRLDGYTKPLPKDFTERLGAAFMKALPKPPPKGVAKPPGKGLPEGLPKPPPEGLGNGVAKGPDQGVLAGATPARTRARPGTRTPPPPPPPGPPPLAHESPSAPRAEQPGRPAAPPHGDEDDEARPGGSGDGETCIREACATVPVDGPASPPVETPPDRPARRSSGQRPEGPAETDGDVWARLAWAKLDAELERGGKVGNRSAWLRTVARNFGEELGDDLDDALAAGLSRQEFVDQVLADAEPAEGIGDRRPPGFEETQAMLAERDARLAAAREREARIDAEIDLLGDGERAALEERARARLGVVAKRLPAAAVWAEMRTLHVEEIGGGGAS